MTTGVTILKLVYCGLVVCLVALGGCLSPPDALSDPEGLENASSSSDALDNTSLPAEKGENTSWPLVFLEKAERTNVVAFSVRGTNTSDVEFTLRVNASWEGHPAYEPPEWGITPTNFSQQPSKEIMGYWHMTERDGLYNINHNGIRLFICSIPTPEHVGLDLRLGPVNESMEYFVGGGRAASGGCIREHAIEEPLSVGSLAPDETFHAVTFASNHTGRLKSGNHSFEWVGQQPDHLELTKVDWLPSTVGFAGETEMSASIEDVPGVLIKENSPAYQGHLDYPAGLRFKPMFSPAVGFAEWYFSVPGRDTVTFQGTWTAAGEDVECVSGCDPGLLPWLVVGGPGDWEVGLTHFACIEPNQYLCMPYLNFIPIDG